MDGIDLLGYLDSLSLFSLCYDLLKLVLWNVINNRPRLTYTRALVRYGGL